jgi:hypothetical protein
LLDENQAAQAAGQERPHNSSAVHELHHFELTERVGRRIAGARVPFEHTRKQYMQSLIDNLRRRFPNIELLEAFGSLFDPKTLVSLPYDSPVKTLNTFGLPGLTYLFKHYSTNRGVEGNQQCSPITKDFARLHQEYKHFLGIVVDGFFPDITACRVSHVGNVGGLPQ